MLGNEQLIELQNFVDVHMGMLAIHEIMFNYTESAYETKAYVEIDDFVKHNRKPTFNRVLFGYMDKKGLTDVDIYNQAGIDRKHFSKIRKPDYHPGKRTVISLALALNLNKKETDSLLSSAGYALSESDTFDLVIRFCLEKKIYDAHDVDAALDYFSLKLLVGTME